MPVNYHTPAAAELWPVAGVRLGVAAAAIRKPDRHDLTVLALDPGCRVAGVFTSNRFCAAPVHVCRRHLELGSDARALLINTGVANAGTGEQACGPLPKPALPSANCWLSRTARCCLFRPA